MLSIFKKKRTEKVDLSEVGTDMHSHLLPGIDDGAPDTDTSLKLISGLQELGYRQCIATPHIMWDLYRNDARTIGKAFEQVNAALPAHQQHMVPRAAAEYYLDDFFDRLLERNEPLLTIRDNWVLVEFSFVTPPLNYKEKIFNLQIKGYQPVLAHPERYTYFQQQKENFAELKSAGCLFQVNLLSLAGYYGKGPEELARWFIRNGWVDLLGTDLHHERHLRVLQTSGSLMAPVKTLLDSGKLLNPQINVANSANK
jgi:protein-tyrosine phosphatase